MPPSPNHPPPYYFRDCVQPSPIVVSSTHSGRFYPPSLLRQARLPVDALRRGEDTLVDSLLGSVGEHGIPLLSATHARAYVDLNRDPAELDPEMYAPQPSIAGLRASDRVAAGLGVIPRALAPGQMIYAGRLQLAEAALRIEAAHAPFHTALARLLDRARVRHGYALLIDVHSMPSQPGQSAPDVVIGDLRGRSADARIVERAETVLREEGFTVARNTPYAGAYTLERHGTPMLGCHAVQLEFDRALYLDARQQLSPLAPLLAARIAAFTARLIENVSQLGLGTPQQIAAE